ncbi:hypothetical protein [Gloeothece verrucosa]|uniref:Bacterial Ig-like domain-containing protein n=1 Tax=Gloeothece verrucosa (strain PCC 7822) TaxID=497965 RepID=E0UFT0_GLOV7|nr:hypothetical protein [Gloeothece verrucosa]ADN13191.1 hypothetical protein Cyan7822_1185 [Gloeothece verrucosa PCC 7822]
MLQITIPNNNAHFDLHKAATFQGTATNGIITVKLVADDKWPLGNANVDPNGNWSIIYSGFTQAGNRQITAIGFDSSNQQQTSTSINIVVSAQLDRIIQAAASSEIADYNWHQRGIAPIGYIKGMALVYGRVYCKLKAGDAAAKEMAKANTGNTEKDALAHYAQIFQNVGMNNDTPGVDTLRHLFVLLIGLGMRESSGKYCEGRDLSADNVTAETAEAGLFQTSYNARSANPLLPQLFQQYLTNPSGFVEVFKEGVTCSNSNWENFGEGQGKEFQRLSKACPAFAAEFAAVGLRNLRKHWGPINTKEAEILPEANTLLLEVQKIVDEFNLCPILH